jgi:hypothetical protein
MRTNIALALCGKSVVRGLLLLAAVLLRENLHRCKKHVREVVLDLLVQLAKGSGVAAESSTVELDLLKREKIRGDEEKKRKREAHKSRCLANSETGDAFERENAGALKKLQSLQVSALLMQVKELCQLLAGGGERDTSE